MQCEAGNKTSGIALKPVLKVNSNKSEDFPKSSYSSAVLTTLDGRIVCDNTVPDRLEVAHVELLPSTRTTLFHKQ